MLSENFECQRNLKILFLFNYSDLNEANCEPLISKKDIFLNKDHPLLVCTSEFIILYLYLKTFIFLLPQHFLLQNLPVSQGS